MVVRVQVKSWGRVKGCRIPAPFHFHQRAPDSGVDGPAAPFPATDRCLVDAEQVGKGPLLQAHPPSKRSQLLMRGLHAHDGVSGLPHAAPQFEGLSQS